jgi:hypothetical protein
VKEIREKSSKKSSLFKNTTIEKSSMEPIKEEKSVLANLNNSKLQHSNKSMSKRSFHEVSMGMLLPKI